MRRRRLLCVLAAAGAGGVAGCLGGSGGGGGGGSGDPESTTTATTTTTTTERTVESVEKLAIDDAERSLRSVAAELSPSPTPTEKQQSIDAFLADPLRERISAAQDDLELAAKGEPSEDQRERIDRLRVIAEFLAAYVDFLAAVKAATREFRTVTDRVDAGIYEGAIEMLESVRSKLGTARGMLEDIDEKGTAVAGHYEPGEPIFDGDLRDLMGEPSEWNVRFDVFEALVEGEMGLVTAFDAYHEGVSADASGDYETAAERFSTASEEAGEARANFQRAMEISTSMKIGADPSQLSCRAGNVEEAADAYREVVAAEMNGTAAQAGTTRSEAREAIDREC